MGINLAKNPVNYFKEDEANYARLMLKTDALHRYYNPRSPHPRSSDSDKWNNILGLKKKT